MKKWELYKSQKQTETPPIQGKTKIIDPDEENRGYLYRDLLRTLVVTLFVLSILAVLIKTQGTWETAIKLP